MGKKVGLLGNLVVKFINEHKATWIYFYPLFIHEEIMACIKSAVDNYQSTDRTAYHKNIWLGRLNEKFEL